MDTSLYRWINQLADRTGWAHGTGQLIGGAIDRARPYETLANVHLLVDKTKDFSFPSDHATAAGAVAVVPVLRRLVTWLTSTPLRPLVTNAARPEVAG